MGPPPGTPRSFKRRILQSTSSRPESSSSGRPHPKVLASDSAAADTSHDLCTPKNRPTALRYISSSSRAISEGRGMARGEIGIAAIDLRHPHLVLCQFSDTLLYTHTLTKINFFNPVEIIVPHTFCEGVQPNQLYQLIRDRYPLVNLVTVQRRHFNDAAGRQHIQTLCAPQYNGVYLQVVHKFYAVTAAAAVLKYVEYIQCIVFARESLKIEYHSSENTMIIDVGTATQLELVQPLVPSAGPTCCLLGVLGPTYTVGGIRALRASILQPSCNKEFIESRLDAVQDLIENDMGLMVDLQDVIKKLSDIDKILLLCMESANQNMDKIGEAQLNQTLLLKVTMDMVPKLVEALNGAVSGRLTKIKLVHHSGASVTMTTEELVVLNQQAKESLTEIQKMSNIVISSLLKDLRPFMSSLYTLCENVAELDVLLAMAQASSIGSYIRPDFNTFMDVRNSVHPLLDYNSQVLPVPNDIFATPEHNFTIITGPNMGGKSIYIKQVAIIQVMAQIGCFLPATNAILRICDRIFSRIGFNDSVELNASTYVFEIKETQHILKGLTPTSLVIIDELCRGTCVEEGASVAWAICEELIMSVAFTFFTTHFMYLTRLQELYFNVLNRHTAVIEEEVGNPENPQKRLVYQHKIEPGVTRIEHYGLALATKTNLPEDTVKLAMELAELISKNTNAQEIRTPQRNDEETFYNLNANIQLECRKYGNSDESTTKILQKFKDDHPQLVGRLNILRSRSDNRTDGSADCTFVPNNYSKEQTSIEVSTTNSFIVNNPAPAKSLINEQLEVIVEENTNYASVRSSEQLLNSVINNEDSVEEENHNISDVEMIEDGNDDLPCIEMNETNIDRSSTAGYNTITETGEIILTTSHLDGTDSIENNEFGENNESAANEDDINEIETSSIDSDIAEALTQIVEEYSANNVTNSQRSYDLMSVDEELMSETINEINEELSSEASAVENIVLTPPLSFRDM